MRKKEKENNIIDGMIPVEKYDERIDSNADGTKEKDDSAEIIPNNENNEEHMFINYEIMPEEVINGLKIFQKKFLYKKNIIYTLIFSAVLIIFSVDIARGANRSFMAFICIGVSMGMIWLVWSFPVRHRKEIANSIDMSDNNFSMKIFNDRIVIPRVQGDAEYYFSGGLIKIIEIEELFVITPGKEIIYILPKRCLKESELEKVSGIFRNILV